MSMDKALEGTGSWLDDRLHGARGVRVFFRKVFPDHWTFLLGEIALYSFIILLLTGTFLTFWFQPSMTEVVYHGSYIQLDGVRMSEAYASTLQHQLRRPRRPADPPDPPLGRRPVRGGDHGAHAADLLHRRLPQAARDQLADRHRAVHARPAGGPVRLLAARRPAVRRRPADHSRA